jgi:surface protein
MKKALVWILVLALLAVASVLGTIAYLMDEATADNVMTVGKIDIELLEYQRVDTEYKDADKIVEEFVDGKPLLPAVVEKGFSYDFSDSDTAHVKWDHDEEGNAIKADYTSPIWDPAKISNEVDKMVFVKNTGDYSAYVRIFFAFEAGNFGTFDEFQKNIHINLNDDEKLWKWEWIPSVGENGEGKYFVATATYKKVLAPDAITEISLSQISLDYTATNNDVEAFGTDYRVLVNVQGIQSSGFSDPETALNEGFGSGVPFENFVIKGVSLYNALHYLNGNDKGTNITTDVTEITFGLNDDYADKVADLAGTYVGEGQTVPVYAYYVPNATDSTKYDIYVLADHKIYTPKDSTGLFKGMSSLKKVETANLDVSKTEIMEDFFRDCSSLSDINVSKWDVSNVTSLNGVFLRCSALTKLDLSSWNVSNVTDFFAMFSSCSALSELNLSGWDLNSATKMNLIFLRCKNLTKLYIHDWDVSAVPLMASMFAECESLTSLDLSGWNTVSLQDASTMFDACSSLETIFVGDGWNMSNVTASDGMFNDCSNLKGAISYNAANANDVTYANTETGYLTYKAAPTTNP